MLLTFTPPARTAFSAKRYYLGIKMIRSQSWTWTTSDGQKRPTKEAWEEPHPPPPPPPPELRPPPYVDDDDEYPPEDLPEPRDDEYDRDGGGGAGGARA